MGLAAGPINSGFDERRPFSGQKQKPLIIHAGGARFSG
jgi:hypothetical protein